MVKAFRGLCRPASGLAWIVLLVVSSSAFALGLGPMQSNTAIGQDFRAKIPIVDYSGNAAANIKAGLASEAVYKQMGLSLQDYLYSLKFSTKEGPKGPYLLVTSDKPVHLPFINLLIRVQWPSGEVTRQYTVLLNPPIYASQQKQSTPVQAPASRPVAVAPQPEKSPPKIEPKPTVSSPTNSNAVSQANSPHVSPTPSQLPTSSSSMPRTYGPIPKGATLWGLAHQLRPSGQVSIDQMMIALYRANPDAFYGNINRLKAGYILKIPSASQVSSVTPVDATRDVAQQDQKWNQLTVAEQPPPKSVSSSVSPSSSVAPSKPNSLSKGASSKAQSKVSSGVTVLSKGGRVILSAPAVTSTTNKASVGAPTAALATHRKASSPAQPGQQAASAATASAAAAKTSAPKAGTVSTSSPVRIASNAMAKLASRKPTAAAKPVVPAKVAAAHRIDTEHGLADTIEEWSTSPKGWVLAAGIILLLLAGALALRKRSGRGGDGSGQRINPALEPSGNGGEVEVDEKAEEMLNTSDQGRDIDFPKEEFEAAEPVSGETVTEISETAPSSEPNDPLGQAELHAGYGRRDQAIEILRDALEKDGSRNDVRMKLLELLFDSGLGSEFGVEAREYHRRMTEDDHSDWEQISVMGRQLLPSDSMFGSENVPQEDEATPEKTGDPSEDDKLLGSGDLEFEMELDRLSGTPSTANDEQREFDKTLEELSTFIETYVPGEQDKPLNIQLPQDMAGKKDAGLTEHLGEDDVLEFELNEDELPSFEAAEPQEEKELYADTVGTKLDLARAYIDMGDNDSAREILEEVIDEGNEDRQREAKQLLESIG